MRRIYIVVSEKTLALLAKVAEIERRDPRQQAAYILEHALAQAVEPQSLVQSLSTEQQKVLAQ